jgi:hypothetical protein
MVMIDGALFAPERIDQRVDERVDPVPQIDLQRGAGRECATGVPASITR